MPKHQLCPKCSSEKIIELKIDERLMFECSTCAHIWYSNRGWTAAHLTIRDDIIEDVEKKGYSTQDYVILNNISFGKSEGISAWDHIQQWAKLNKLKVTLEGDTVRFSR